MVIAIKIIVGVVLACCFALVCLIEWGERCDEDDDSKES